MSTVHMSTVVDIRTLGLTLQVNNCKLFDGYFPLFEVCVTHIFKWEIIQICHNGS